MTTNKPAESAGVARIAGNMMIVVGALGIVLWLLGKAFVSPPLAEVVVYANVSACLLDVALGIGVVLKKRAAWSFAVSMFVVLIIVNLLALPGMYRAGWPIGGLSALLAGARLVWGALLLVGKDDI